VDVAKIEALMAQAGELLVSKISAEQRLAELKSIRADVNRQRRARRRQTGLRRTSPSKNGHDPELVALADLVNSNESLLGELAARLGSLEQNLSGDTLRLELVTSDLQDGVRRVRMLPFSTILSGFQRMVRDLARELDKDVILQVEGAKIELDKKVLEEIRDPIMHLLRNAIDHGIELPDERESLGKPRQGTVRLTVSHQGKLIAITVEDDGRGIDVGAIRQAAVRAGAINLDELAELPDATVARLMLLPGVTTSGRVTDVSGRGVGLDVVRQKVEDLQGQVEIDSLPEEGSRFRLTVPVSLATARGLLVGLGDEIYAIPLSAIDRIVMVNTADVRSIEGQHTLSVDGQPVALVRLTDVLERPSLTSDMAEVGQAVLVRSGEVLIAFLVDELLDVQEMVVKGLGKQLSRVRNVAGATLLGTGQVVIILNTVDLVRSAQGAASPGLTLAVPEREIISKSTILIVDDSITTRTLEKNILEAAGYEVVTAVDGLEAMSYLQRNGCDLIVSDIQMPRMDGFEFTEAVKSSSDLGALPLILVTSLESQADKERGLSAGADAYIVKSAFDQADLLATIEQLL
jgi:two-component system chemotaxis sensor kinase CheA